MDRYRVVLKRENDAVISASFKNWRQFKRWYREYGKGLEIVEKGVSLTRAKILVSRRINIANRRNRGVTVLAPPEPRYRDHRWFDGYDAHFPVAEVIILD